MKKIFLLCLSFLTVILFSCQGTDNDPKPNLKYQKNLSTAKKFFELFLTEDLDAQIPLICPGVTHYPPFYGSEPGNYDAFIAAGKGWMDNFDEITYNAEVWLPGTDSLGVFDGSVRTYGSWSAKNSNTGNVIQNRAYHSFEFNDAGQIHELRDYFDASGAMNAALASVE